VTRVRARARVCVCCARARACLRYDGSVLIRFVYLFIGRSTSRNTGNASRAAVQQRRTIIGILMSRGLSKTLLRRPWRGRGRGVSEIYRRTRISWRVLNVECGNGKSGTYERIARWRYRRSIWRIDRFRSSAPLITHAGCVFKCQGGMPGGPGFHAEQGVHPDTPPGQQQR
jgi:hypothetical protein